MIRANHRLHRTAILILLLSILTGCFEEPTVEPLIPGRELSLGECNDYNPHKNAYFGDLHTHTSFSLDAVQFDTRNDPDAAYRFAKGEAIGLPPLDENGDFTRQTQLSRPLDFAGVSDHAEFLAEADICFNSNSWQYYSPYCATMRGSKEGGTFMDFVAFLLGAGPASVPGGQFKPSICSWSDNETLCNQRENNLWQQVQNAAERHYDRSTNCSFTTFIGYEWTGTPGVKNQHRNVFFRDATVPAQTLSYFDAWQPHQLWERLDKDCVDSGSGCQVLTIPHNSNLGGGAMFNPLTEEGNPYTPALAATRARMEPLVEIFNHKGTSECVPGQVPFASNDEACSFELVLDTPCTGADSDPDDCAPLCSSLDFGASLTGACIEPSDFARGALRQGLLTRADIGVNPFKFGFIGSTDNHNATPGNTEEYDWPGHAGINDDSVAERVGLADAVQGPFIETLGEAIPAIGDLSGLGNLSVYGPGGLAVVWAEQNSRHALFDSMRRKEAYATSGTRILLRLFAGDNVSDTLCEQADFAAQGYRQGVPMGGDLPQQTQRPAIAVSARMDSGTVAHPGTPLQRIQIVKGWTDGLQTYEKVYDIAGAPDNGASVDLQSCVPQGLGFSQLCTVWRDPEFDPDQSAFYYARVLENPSCRWSHRQCNAAMAEQQLTCADVDADHPLAKCCDDSLAKTIQERAVSSPVWYQGT